MVFMEMPEVAHGFYVIKWIITTFSPCFNKKSHVQPLASLKSITQKRDFFSKKYVFPKFLPHKWPVSYNAKMSSISKNGKI